MCEWMWADVCVDVYVDMDLHVNVGRCVGVG